MKVDVSALSMYAEFAAILALIVLGTIAFTHFETDAWIVPFVLLGVAVALAASILRKHLMRLHCTLKDDDAPQESFDALPAGVIWICWLAYGALFADVPPLLSGSLAYVHGVVIAVLVLMSHSRANVRRDWMWASGLLLVVGALLFLPHPDTLSKQLPPAVLYLKIVLFYALFVVTEIAQKLAFESNAVSASPPTEPERVYSLQVQVVQSAWVLLSMRQLLPIALLQMFILGVEIRAHLHERAMAVHALPVTKQRQQRSSSSASSSSERQHSTATSASEDADVSVSIPTPARPPEIMTLNMCKDKRAMFAATASTLFSQPLIPPRRQRQRKQQE